MEMCLRVNRGDAPGIENLAHGGKKDGLAQLQVSVRLEVEADERRGWSADHGCWTMAKEARGKAGSSQGERGRVLHKSFLMGSSNTAERSRG